MLGLFKNKKERLESKYKQLMNEAHRLEFLNRDRSDKKLIEAKEVLAHLQMIERG